MADLLLHLVCGLGIGKYLSARKIKKRVKDVKKQGYELEKRSGLDESRGEDVTVPLYATAMDADTLDNVTGVELLGMEHGDLHSIEFGLSLSTIAGLVGAATYKKKGKGLMQGFNAGALRAGLGCASHFILDKLTNLIGFEPLCPSISPSEFAQRANEYISQFGLNQETLSYIALSSAVILSSYYFHMQEKKARNGLEELESRGDEK